MKHNEREKLSHEMIEMFNVCRVYMFSCLSGINQLDRDSRYRATNKALEYYDMAIKGTQEQGFTPVVEAKELREQLRIKIHDLVICFDNGQLSQIETASHIAGLIIETGLKAFGTHARFFMQPLN